MGAQGGQEVERREDAGRRGLGFAAAAVLPAVVDHLAGFGAIAQAFEGDGWLEHVAGQAPTGIVIFGSNRLALENGETGMGPVLHDFDQAGRDLFPGEKGPDELVAEKLHEADRIRARDGNQRTIGGYQAVGDQTVQMGMKPGGIVAVALQRGNHAGEGAAISGGILKELLDRGIKGLAQ